MPKLQTNLCCQSLSVPDMLSDKVVMLRRDRCRRRYKWAICRRTRAEATIRRNPPTRTLIEISPAYWRVHANDLANRIHEFIIHFLLLYYTLIRLWEAENMTFTWIVKYCRLLWYKYTIEPCWYVLRFRTWMKIAHSYLLTDSSETITVKWCSSRLAT